MSLSAEQKRENFSRKMVDILNAGAINLGLAIGYKLGLLDALEACGSPETAATLARAAGLNLRYVTEWLGIMISAGVVEVETGGDELKYFLPPEHAACLTRNAGNANLGVYTQEIPLLTQCALDAVSEGFKTGDGVEYSRYPRFQAFMTELSNAKHTQVLVDQFLPGVDRGRITALLKQGVKVCDLGCGEGVAALLMARAFPCSEFIGLDISAEVIEQAQARADREGLKNLRYLVRDAARLAQQGEFTDYFDYVVAFDSIHDQTAPLAALESVRSILRPGGAFSMIDIAAETNQADNIAHPMGPFLYTVSLMHCLPVGLANQGAGLGMMWGRQKAVRMLEEAGFGGVEVREIEGDSFNLHFFCRK
ncbi:MAG: class I SAM-dependent methyltransferase [Pseudomonadota bacterium]